MTRSVTQTLGRSLVRDLGRDCGVAALVARVLATAPPRAMTEEALAARGGVGPRSLGAARRALADFEQRGWCSREVAGWRVAEASIPTGLADFLAGAAAMRGHGHPEVSASPIVTLPAAPCLLGEELPRTGLAYVRLVRTEAAFSGLARAATRRFTVMTPFLNKDGVDWALALFRQTSAPERTLVVRGWRRVAPLFKAHREELLSLGISVLDYLLPGGPGEGFERRLYTCVT